MRLVVLLVLPACTPKPVSLATLQPGAAGTLSVSVATPVVCPGDEVDVVATVTTRSGEAIGARSSSEDWHGLTWLQPQGVEPLDGGRLRITGRDLGEVTADVGATLAADGPTARLTLQIGHGCDHVVDLSGEAGAQSQPGSSATALHVRAVLGSESRPLLRVVVSNGTVTRPLTLDPATGTVTVLGNGGDGGSGGDGGDGAKVVITLGPGAERYADRIRIRNTGGQAGAPDAAPGRGGGPAMLHSMEASGEAEACAPEFPFYCLQSEDSPHRRPTLLGACADGWLPACAALAPEPKSPFDQPLKVGCDARAPASCLARHAPSSDPFAHLEAGLAASCAAGSPEGCTWHRRLGGTSDDDDVDYAEPLAAWAACEAGSVWACGRTGMLVRADEDAMHARLGRTGFGRACAAGDGTACAGYAWFFESGGAGTVADLPRAVALYDRGCELDAPAACTSLGWMTQHGKGTDADPARALELYRASCAGGDGRGCGNVGALFQSGSPPSDPDSMAAVEWFARGCVLDHGASCVAEGDVWADPEGPSPDPQRAVSLFARACDLHAASGCNQLGIAHESGRGVPMDLIAAGSHYLRACDLGNGVGCSNLGALHQFGRGRPSDAKTALALYARACTLGSGAGCTNLGYLTENGLGQPADRTAALRHYDAACKLGDDTGCTNLAILRDQTP